VKAELERLDAGSPVFKMVGSVLMKQELDEAKQNVEKRIEFIVGEM
jgi:prefoldin beta subunit